MSKHDENRDLRSFSRIGKVNYSDKTLQCSKSATIGIHLWGKIDYLTKYCGWHFIWNNNVGVGGFISAEDNPKKQDKIKKIKKAHANIDKPKKAKKK